MQGVSALWAGKLVFPTTRFRSYLRRPQKNLRKRSAALAWSLTKKPACFCLDYFEWNAIQLHVGRGGFVKYALHSLDLSGITSARGGTSGTFGRGSWCLHKNIQHLHLPQRYCNSGYYNGRTGMTLQNISRTISIRPCHKIQFHIIVSSQMTPSKPSVVPRLLRGCVQPWASRACRPPRTLPRPSP